MKCLFYFKEKSKITERRSAPELKEGRKSDNSPSRRATKSASMVGGGTSPNRSIPELFEEKAHNLRVFSLPELQNATNNFSILLKIGEGGFGIVYKGFLKPADGKGDRTVVAIKKLNKESLQGHKQWKAEVQFLAVVDHPNLVKLIGYCSVDGERGIQRLLVYEFMPNKSLEDHLFNRALPVLPWNLRLQIILGAAEGLAYLHEGLEVQVIYRDFKASNVLLDKDFKPKLSDFGLAREGPSEGKTHVSTAVVGTHGYAAPDYIETGHLTAKSDVWSFGVVLYEILSGRRSLERNRPRTEQKLLDWVKQFPAESRRFYVIMDPRLGNRYSLGAACAIAKLADNCLSKNSKERPKMSEVVERLKQAIQISETESTQEMKTRSPKEMNAGACSTDLNANNKKPDQVDSSDSEYSRRRMAHLAKLRENANAVGGRRFTIMPSAKVP